jgi:hypothetical protein
LEVGTIIIKEVSTAVVVDISLSWSLAGEDLSGKFVGVVKAAEVVISVV